MKKEACCVRGCENTDLNTYHLPIPKKNLSQAPTTYVVSVCEPCEALLVGESVKLNYYQGGRMAFVNEIWMEKAK